jgi:hypothetical protein
MGRRSFWQNNQQPGLYHDVYLQCELLYEEKKALCLKLEAEERLAEELRRSNDERMQRVESLEAQCNATTGKSTNLLFAWISCWKKRRNCAGVVMS